MQSNLFQGRLGDRLLFARSFHAELWWDSCSECSHVHPLAAALSTTVLENASPIGYQSQVIWEPVPWVVSDMCTRSFQRDAGDLALLLE